MPINHEDPPDYAGLDGLIDDAEYWRDQDIKENAESEPPDGEVIQRPVVKVAECFVGGDLASLVDGCRALGIPEHRILRSQTVYKWAEQVRGTSRSGSWVDIATGYQRDPDSQRSWPDAVEMELPADFESVELKAFSPIPSIVFLVATFRLTASAAGSLDDELRSNRYLRLEKRGRATLYSSAVHRKGDALRSDRTRVVEVASTWVAQTFAGTFSGDFSLPSLPAIEFLTTQSAEPFTDVSRDPGISIRTDYRMLLSIDSASEAWQTAEAPGWRLGMPWRDTDSAWTLVAACKLSADAADAADPVEPESPRPAPEETHALGWSFDGVLIRFASLCLLVQYERKFGALRDELASSGSEHTALALLDRANTTLNTLSFDAYLAASEIKQWTENDWLWRLDCIEPTTASPWRQEREDYPSFLKLLADNLNSRSDWILGMEPRIREELVGRTSILATSANLRLQQLVLYASLIALVVAVTSIVLQLMKPN